MEISPFQSHLMFKASEMYLFKLTAEPTQISEEIISKTSKSFEPHQGYSLQNNHRTLYLQNHIPMPINP